MSKRKHAKVQHGHKKSGGMNSVFGKLEKKLTQVQVSENAYIKFSPNPKKLFTFNLKF